MIRKIFILVASLAVVLCASAQKTVRVDAIKANDYGVVYSLPKTSFEVKLLVKKTTNKRGDFYPYAQRYLGIDKPIMEDGVVYSLENVDVANKGIPDKSNSFMLEFRGRTVQPFVTLSDDGLIIAINAEPEAEKNNNEVLPECESNNINPRRYMSQETLMAGSTAKQAELVARQIFDIRRNRNDILSGEAESMPPDGNAYNLVMSELNTQEKALTSMFAGSTECEYFIVTYNVVPEDKDINKLIIARFSKKLGPVDADNLAGEPIYFSLTNKTPKPNMQLSDKELQRLENKLSEGVVYNIPGKANLSVEFMNDVKVSREVDVVQYGSQDVLVKKMFENNKQPIKVYFYPELGAIKQIIQ
ncbi:MAG: DUF4831 family protein [Fermentimonas sp.]|jgi:hypothetical protein